MNPNAQPSATGASVTRGYFPPETLVDIVLILVAANGSTLRTYFNFHSQVSGHRTRHVKTCHSDEKPFRCPECDTRFSRRDNMRQHLKTHKRGDSDSRRPAGRKAVISPRRSRNESAAVTLMSLNSRTSPPPTRRSAHAAADVLASMNTSPEQGKTSIDERVFDTSEHESDPIRNQALPFPMPAPMMPMFDPSMHSMPMMNHQMMNQHMMMQSFMFQQPGMMPQMPMVTSGMGMPNGMLRMPNGMLGGMLGMPNGMINGMQAQQAKDALQAMLPSGHENASMGTSSLATVAPVKSEEVRSEPGTEEPAESPFMPLVGTPGVSTPYKDEAKKDEDKDYFQLESKKTMQPSSMRKPTREGTGYFELPLTNSYYPYGSGTPGFVSYVPTPGSFLGATGNYVGSPGPTMPPMMFGMSGAAPTASHAGNPTTMPGIRPQGQH